ncbi:hypothetical protein HOE04_04755 [archaeon]|jgi:hypothetical protein|nr:hypothetical protein [archaeon]
MVDKILGQNGLRQALSKIVEGFDDVEEIMSCFPQKSGQVHKSLKPRGEEFIVQSSNGFVSAYEDEDGTLYSISIHKQGGQIQ